jgi:hypothetical protein
MAVDIKVAITMIKRRGSAHFSGLITNGRTKEAGSMANSMDLANTLQGRSNPGAKVNG